MHTPPRATPPISRTQASGIMTAPKQAKIRPVEEPPRDQMRKPPKAMSSTPTTARR